MAYTLERGLILGTGGSSNIYRCRDMIGIRSACKVIPKSKLSNEKFKKEVACMKDLAFSPKVVQLYDVFETDEEYYIVMEWCRGGAIRDYTSNHILYSENTVSSFVRGCLRGLYHIHGSGIIHRDIKPGNILLSDMSCDAEVKIADFGSAVRMTISNQLVETADTVGTPWYMSPESITYKSHPKSDIWSLGVMTYQLLTGYMPFDDFTSVPPRLSQICNSIFNDDPKWTGKRWENISEEARDFIKQCLKKDWQNRPYADELLMHSWLQKTNCEDRFTGNPIELRRINNRALSYNETI